MKLFYEKITQKNFLMNLAERSTQSISDRRSLACFRLDKRLLGKLGLGTLSLWVMMLGLVWGPLLYAQTFGGVNKFTLDEYQAKLDGKYIYGFDTLHFFMTLEEVKAKLSEAGYDTGVTLEEFDSDIYSFPGAIRQDFVHYEATVNQFRPFSIYPGNMEAFLNKIINKGADTRILHLSKRYKKDFKLVIVPVNLENSRPWELRLSFFNRRFNDTRVYRLFAIAVGYKGTQKQIRNFTVIPERTLELARKQIYAKYGFPNFKRSVIMGEQKEAEKFYELFLRYYVSEDYEYNADLVKNFSLPIQINLTHVVVGGKIGNFQISYVATDYIRELLPYFTSSQYKYDDVDLDESIEINF